MRKEEVVKWLESLKNEIGKAENRTLWHYAESIDIAIEALSEPKIGKWIPVSEKLPEKDERVLVTAWGDVDIAWIDKYGLWQTEEYTYHSQDDVIAWMFLPEPWKDGE